MEIVVRRWLYLYSTMNEIILYNEIENLYFIKLFGQ